MTIRFANSKTQRHIADVRCLAVAIPAFLGCNAFAQDRNPLAEPPPNVSSAAPVLGKALPARPSGSPAEWASDDDYPPKALRSGATGYVGFQLIVSASGQPTACEVLFSSRNDDLDKTTCDLMMKRARFNPATDETGKAIEGSFRSSVTWRIPEGRPPMPPPSGLLVTYDVMPNGFVANCTVTISGAMLTKIKENPNDYCSRLGPYAPPLDAHGKPVKRHVVAESSVTIADAP